MNLDDFIIENYIKRIGHSSFSVFCYISLMSKGELKRIRLTEIMSALNLSKPSVTKCLKKLISYKMIKTEKKLINGRKNLFMKSLKVGKKILPAYIINISINSNKYNKTYKEIYYKIIKKVLKHARYSNDYYLKRKWKYGEREEAHIERLITSVDSVSDYVDWWLKNKSSKVPGLNIGLITCVPMLEEYKLKSGKKLYHEKDKRKAIDDLRKRMITSLVKDNSPLEKMNEHDREFLQEALDDKLVSYEKNKYIINF